MINAGGIHIREYYVSIAPPNNAALPGLATDAAAQLVELGLAESLTGVPAHDLPILETIKGDVMTGIQLNENNTAAVRQCLLLSCESAVGRLANLSIGFEGLQFRVCVSDSSVKALPISVESYQERARSI